jgi:hypothetical protein
MRQDVMLGARHGASVGLRNGLARLRDRLRFGQSHPNTTFMVTTMAPVICFFRQRDFGFFDNVSVIAGVSL